MFVRLDPVNRDATNPQGCHTRRVVHCVAERVDGSCVVATSTKRLKVQRLNVPLRNLFRNDGGCSHTRISLAVKTNVLLLAPDVRKCPVVPRARLGQLPRPAAVNAVRIPWKRRILHASVLGKIFELLNTFLYLVWKSVVLAV